MIISNRYQNPICFLWLLVFTIISSMESRSQTTVAVGDFQNLSSRLYLDSWTKQIPEFLYNELSQKSEIIMVDRQNLQSILDEQALSMAGLIDSSTVQEVGKLLGAEYVITGSINDLDHWIRIDARIIHIASGKVVTEMVKSPTSHELEKMVSLLGINLQYQLTGKGDHKDKMVITSAPVKPFLITTLMSASTTLVLHFLYKDSQENYRTESRISRMDPAYNTANQLYQARNIFISVTGTSLLGTLICWLHNMNPQTILAYEPAIQPYIIQRKGEFAVGIRWSF